MINTLKISPYSCPGLSMKPNIMDRFKRIEKLCLDYFNVPIETIKKRGRKRNIIVCRHVLFYFQHRYSTRTLVNIGKEYGFDHTSVLHASKKVEDLVRLGDSLYRDPVSYLEKKIDA